MEEKKNTEQPMVSDKPSSPIPASPKKEANPIEGTLIKRS